MNDHFHDRLIDTLLEEIHRPTVGRDLSAAVFAQTTRRATRGYYRLGRLAAAVLVGAVALQFSIRWAATQTAPETKINSVSAPEPRQTVFVGQSSKALLLRGYCRLELKPHTQAEIIGQAGDERVLLQQGALLCKVDRAALHESGLSLDEFKILFPGGEISTKGTKLTEFRAELRESTEPMTRGLWVKVISGAVLVSNRSGRALLVPGEEQFFPAPSSATP